MPRSFALAVILSQSVNAFQSFHEIDFAKLGRLTKSHDWSAVDRVGGVAFVKDSFVIHVHHSSTVELFEVNKNDYRMTELDPIDPNRKTEIKSIQAELLKQLQENRQVLRKTVGAVTLGNASLHTDAGWNLILETQLTSKVIFTLKPSCDANTQMISQSQPWHYFFLNSNRILVSDCGRFKAINTEGLVQYSLPPMYPTAAMKVGKRVFATLEPSWTFWGHLIPWPEDSSKLQVFCVENGKRLLVAHWPHASGNNLVLSNDDKTAAIPGRFAVRFYSVTPDACSK